ncbi:MULTISPECIES: hypothetical protein [unclassified Curtobacterium]|uniref:hypothetical protein n=1 Tax=unclassified Curtobacterium TaxID=257496 RepID=UPI0038086B94
MMDDHGATSQSTVPPARNRAGWHLLWTVPVAIATNAVLAFIAWLANWGNSAGASADEGLEGYLLSQPWIWLTLIGLITFVALAAPSWSRSVVLRMAIAVAVALTATTAAALFILRQ